MLTSADRREWGAFRARFVTPDGRVVDSYNKWTSSECQGYGLVIAEAAADRAGFEAMLAWTRANLRIRGDNLHAWRWNPADTPRVKGDSRNAATDGDLMIAWALLRAAARWNRPEWHQEALAIAQDIRAKLVSGNGDALTLLPGEWAWKPGQVIINPSYLIVPALRALHRAVPGAGWDTVLMHGLHLLASAIGGDAKLPADWAALTPQQPRPKPIALNPGDAIGFRFDAVRVPLNLAWGGLVQQPGVTAPAAFWAAHGNDKLQVFPDRLEPYPGNIGIEAIASLARAAIAGDLSRTVVKPVAQAHFYYDAALSLLVRLARAEGTALTA